jgi:glycosyltransferase involved in cell wall biosynthesis
MLQNLYSEDFHIDIDYQPKTDDDKYWDQYQIVHFHRNIGNDYESTPALIEKLKSKGIVVIMDIDDYWLPTKEHPIRQLILNNKIHEKIVANMKVCSYITTTTELFPTPGTETEINTHTGQETRRAIKPEETVWVKYESIFTDNYKIITPKYKTFLDKFNDEEYLGWENENYVRVWTKPTTSYAKNYSKFDISLAPIVDHVFNRMKSQLKVIEAGFYKKALIASNVGPYTIDLKHSLNNGSFTDGNALLVDKNRNHGDWAKYVKKLVDNPNMIVDMGERLYETVKDKYNLVNVTKTRAEFYKSLIK